MTQGVTRPYTSERGVASVLIVLIILVELFHIKAPMAPGPGEVCTVWQWKTDLQSIFKRTAYACSLELFCHLLSGILSLPSAVGYFFRILASLIPYI